MALAAALALPSLAVAQPSAQTAPEDTWLHRIVPGDTLIGLQADLMRPESDWRVVQRLNRIRDPRRLQPGSTLRIPLSMLRQEPVSAEVLHLHGEVFVERGDGAREPLQPAALLRSGDSIATGAQSSVSLRLLDGSRTLLGPDSRLRIERHGRLGARGDDGAGGVMDAQLQLDAGGVETRVPPAQRPPPRLQLRTPVVNLGVRGTEFRARIAGEQVLAEVLQGRVALDGAGSGVVLAAGFGSVAAAGALSPPAALPAAPDLGALPAQVGRLPLRFEFPALAGAARYRAQLFAAGTDRLLLDGVSDRAEAAWPDSPADGGYELRVRAARADGLEGRDARHAFTLKARPEPPFQLRPRAGQTLDEAEVGFAWSAHPEAVRYRLQVAAQPDFADPIVDRDDLSGTEAEVTLPIGTWYWRLATVRAGDDTGPWSDAVELGRVDPPPAPPVQPPQAGDDGLTIRWAASPQPGVRYHVQVARDAAFTQRVLDETTDSSERLLPDPDPGTYHVRVRTVGADGRAGAYGAAQVVEVPRSYGWLWWLPLLLLL